MDVNDIVFTFPFTLPTLMVAVVSYLMMTPLVTRKWGASLGHYVLIGVLTAVFANVFTIGYGLRFLLALTIMFASRERLKQMGWLKELSLVVVTLVVAILFVGLR